MSHEIKKKQGVRVDPDTGKPVEVENEADHFMECGVCGQMFDMRDLDDVGYHLNEEHEPRPEN